MKKFTDAKLKAMGWTDLDIAAANGCPVAIERLREKQEFADWEAEQERKAYEHECE